ncbi:MAG: matrixin family metalloprotease [Oligoflexia bacterium]|nr:matrixin family metalloprotease [Oligoflexia bacterium]MBF0366795.1 matrixin family metalloprotease [Oligoflexia bacterium]
MLRLPRSLTIILSHCLLFCFFVSCGNKSQQLQTALSENMSNKNGQSGSGGGNGSASNAPVVRWNANAFPLNIAISDNFTPEESAAAEEVSQEWEQAFDDYHHLFRFSPYAPTPSGYNKFSDFRDGVMGIYKNDRWFPSQYADALAITQFFGHRINPGREDEYIELDHADIILNARYFSFTLDTEYPVYNRYDLKTVVLHEMGHLLGLPHSEDNTTIMAPSITYSTVRNTLSSKDRYNLQKNYPALSVKSFDVEATSEEYLDNSERIVGEEVTGVIEFHEKDYPH